MLFKKIEMHGFKSFAEPVTIEFNKGITGIVGPNGSGKSNISDAIRWVLGEQSPKMLRGGKMEEVIFNGTDSRKSRGMAEVTLVIDNSDNSLPIDYKEVAITRRMFRSGESEYHINGNQCRLRDIRELIMDTGIGVDGYSLIGQGKISDILSNKTESRREIFEEAAGIVAYRTKKAESERKLASTMTNMDRVQDIIGEIEGRIDGLREDSIKAKEYVKLRQRHKELEINIILKNVESLELKNEYAKDDLLNVNYSIDNTKEEKAQIDAELSEINIRNESLEAISVEARNKLIEAIGELNSLVNKGQFDKQRLSTIDDNTARLISEIQQLEEKKERELGNAESVNAEKKEADAKAEEAERILNEKVEEYNSLSAEMTDLVEATDSFKDDIFRLSGEITSAKAEISSLERIKGSLSSRQEELFDERQSGEDLNRETIDNLNDSKRERDQLNDSIESKRESKSNVEKLLSDNRISERSLAKDYEELRISLSRMSARKKTIEEMESNYEGYNSAVRFIMKSGLRGIHGVVADLITVPRGYETAIETALGGALQNIVCDDDNSAKKAISALKENKAGRMTFLPLESIRARESRSAGIEKEAGFIGYGPECLEYDDKYDEIIRYLLARTIVADTMDAAIRISKKASGMRIVTLEGEIINAGGSITGGRYKNKTANILDRKAEIAGLADDISASEKQQDDVRNKLTQIRNDIADAETRISQLENEIREDEHRLIIMDNEISLAENSLRDYKSAGEKINRELTQIKDEQSKSDKLIAEFKSKIADNEAAIKQTELSSEEKLKEYESRKSEFDAIAAKITEARISVTSCNERKNHADDIVRRIQAAIDEIDFEIDSKKDELEGLKNEKAELTCGHEDIDELIREKEEQKVNAEEYLNDITEEKASLTAEISKLSADRDRISDKLQTLQNQKYELEVRKTKNETQLETYKEKLWEDFEVSYIQAMEFKSEDFAMSSAVKENRQIKNRIRELGEVNVGAIEEYETVRERYEFLETQRADIQEAVDKLNEIIARMDKTIRTKFKESFDQIVVNFEKQFQTLFAGGHAELRLSDENNPLESNIDIVAQPPGKKLQNINLLSGGEKTLTAIALMFAVLQAKPTPFCILDEVEAALDDANIDRFIQCLRQFEEIQFALVTHQKATMEHADVLYGVTMPEKGVSKVLSLSLEDDLDKYSA